MSTKTDTNGFQDKLHSLTGTALKRVQQCAGAEIAKADNVQLIFAVGYVDTLSREQLKKWGKAEVDGWNDYLDDTSYHDARVKAGVDEEDSDPKDKPAS